MSTVSNFPVEELTNDESEWMETVTTMLTCTTFSVCIQADSQQRQHIMSNRQDFTDFGNRYDGKCTC